MTRAERLKESIPMGDGTRYFSLDYLKNSKTCSVCKKRKLIEDFPEEAISGRYENAICKDCATMPDVERSERQDEKTDSLKFYKCRTCKQMLPREAYNWTETIRKSDSGKLRVQRHRQFTCKACTEAKNSNTYHLVVTEKTCVKCKRTLPISQFHADRSRRDGHLPFCKNCKNEVNAAYRKKIKENKPN